MELLRRYPGISQRALATEAGWLNEKGAPTVTRVNRLLHGLKRDKLVKIFRGKWCLTEAGKKEAGA